MKKKCKMKKGMTLIEAIISVALLSILIVPISGMIMNSLRSNKEGEFKQNAAYVGQRTLEEIGTYDYINLQTDGSDTFFQLLNGDRLVKQDDGSYSGEVDDDNLPNSYRVTVTLEKEDSFKYEDKNNLVKFKTTPWKFHMTGNTFRLYSPTSDTGDADTVKISGAVADKITININNSSNIELGNLSGVVSSAKFNKNYGDDRKILLYLTDSAEINYPDVEVKNTGRDTVTVYVVKENADNEINVSATGGNIALYDDLLANEKDKVGDFFNINVHVVDTTNGDEVFSGHTTSNIVFN